MKRENIKLNKIIFILALIFMGVRIDLVGSISLTEIYVALQAPSLYRWIKRTHKPYLHFTCNLFIVIIAFQALSEIMVGNTWTNALKGIAVTAMALLLFVFFLRHLCKDISLIKWIPLALLINLILWGDQFGYAEDNESTYFKFYLGPIIVYAVCYLSMVKSYLINKNILLIFLATSLFVIIGGARSLGFSLLFATLFCYIYNRYRTINLKKILPGMLIVAILFQVFYAFVYVPKVISGDWGSPQNRAQLARINNSKNIFMMLFSARSDFYVAYLAFMDKPLWGHGAWAEDKNLKYARIQAKLFPLENTKVNKEVKHLVPAHSVVMGMGVRNGIFTFIAFLGLYIFIYYIGFKSLYLGSPYNIFNIYMIISSFQHLMFGPPAILKNNGAIAFAIFFALLYFKDSIKRRKYEV